MTDPVTIKVKFSWLMDEWNRLSSIRGWSRVRAITRRRLEALNLAESDPAWDRDAIMTALPEIGARYTKFPSWSFDWMFVSTEKKWISLIEGKYRDRSLPSSQVSPTRDTDPQEIGRPGASRKLPRGNLARVRRCEWSDIVEGAPQCRVPSSLGVGEGWFCIWHGWNIRQGTGEDRGREPDVEAANDREGFVKFHKIGGTVRDVEAMWIETTGGRVKR